MRFSDYTLIQYNWCPYKIKKLGHKHVTAKRKDTGRSEPPKVKERGFRTS
jgi:hypothetical protein